MIKVTLKQRLIDKKRNEVEIELDPFQFDFVSNSTIVSVISCTSHINSFCGKISNKSKLDIQGI